MPRKQFSTAFHICHANTTFDIGYIKANTIICNSYVNIFVAYKTSKDFQLNLYRILQEQFRNIVKYSQASIIEIEGFISNKNIYVAITDNGVGFNIADIKSGIGMANMKRRTELFSGQFKIDSSLGNGCKVFIEVPLLGVVVE